MDTFAHPVGSGNDTATREDIESAAREANCEFVWGMPNGFDTESMLQSSRLLDTSLNQVLLSWTS